jgi:hypothetical protein
MAESLGIICVGFDVTEKMEVQWNHTSAIHRFQESHDSVRREISSNILTVTGVPTEPNLMTKVCLHETYSKICRGKQLFDNNFPTQNGLKQGDALSPLLFNFVLDYAIKKAHITRLDWH